MQEGDSSAAVRFDGLGREGDKGLVLKALPTLPDSFSHENGLAEFSYAHGVSGALSLSFTQMFLKHIFFLCDHSCHLKEQMLPCANAVRLHTF